MCDFGAHETIQLFKFLSPSPPFNPAGFGKSHHHLVRLFRHFRLATESDFFMLHHRLTSEQNMCFSFLWYSFYTEQR